MNQLDGKVAIVTGGGTGIGAGIARRLVAVGCRVVIAGRRPGPLQDLAREISGLAVVADVAREADVAALMAACDRAHGRLDILVNNAGQVGPLALVADMDMAAWQATFAVNVSGLVMCIKHATPLLKRQGGAIVNIGSRLGLHPTAARCAYGASKRAVIAITECAAQELGHHGIRVNVVCPGAVDTPAWRDRVTQRARRRGQDPAEVLATRWIETAALGRLVAAEEVAEAVLFLAGTSAITGTTLEVDCGRA